MKKIGQGLQFHVYDHGKKVIKFPTSKKQIKRILCWWHPSYIFRPFALEEKASKAIWERQRVITELKKRRIKESLLGNLEFEEEQIKQDKVVLLRDKLQSKKATKYIEKYIAFIFECWENGFSERTFNLTINNGIDCDENIMLIDFGEITFKKRDVEKAIRSKRWQQSWSFKKDMNEKIKRYYNKRMNISLTLTNLDKYWREAPPHN